MMSEIAQAVTSPPPLTAASSQQDILSRIESFRAFDKLRRRLEIRQKRANSRSVGRVGNAWSKIGRSVDERNSTRHPQWSKAQHYRRWREYTLGMRSRRPRRRRCDTSSSSSSAPPSSDDEISDHALPAFISSPPLFPQVDVDGHVADENPSVIDHAGSPPNSSSNSPIDSANTDSAANTASLPSQHIVVDAYNVIADPPPRRSKRIKHN